MNLLCPNCQKMLTVPEQYAGQLMKCPLCESNFTVPALPPGGEPAPAFSPPPSAPAFAAPPAGSDPSPAFGTPPPMPSAPATYGMANEPEPAFPAPEPPPPSAPPPSAPPQPAFLGPTPTPPPQAPPQAPPADFGTPRPSTATTPGEYTGGCEIVFSDKVLQWVPAGALVLIFLMQFLFSWVGVYPGGVAAATQGPWEAATGYFTPNKDLRDEFQILTAARAKELNDGLPESEHVVANEPGFSPLLFFYLVPFFFLALVASVGVVVLPMLKVQLPPQVEQLLPWKWAIVLGLNGVLLLFLLMQMMLGFSLESSYTNWVLCKPSLKVTEKDTTPEEMMKAVQRGKLLGQLQRTYALYVVFLLHVLATASAGLVYWMERRGPSAPLPVLELKW